MAQSLHALPQEPPSSVPESYAAPVLDGIDSSGGSEATDDEDEAIETSTPASDNKGGTPQGGWTPWAYKKLMKLVTNAKGAASKPVVYFIKRQYAYV